MSNKVCILDYGSGNVRSVYNIFTAITSDVVISNDVAVIEAATHLVLPGVGAFGAAMTKIHEKIPVSVLEHHVMDRKKPFLGICVGMQVLASTGFEFGEHAGLGWIPGEVVKINSGNLPLPHVGWNDVNTQCTTALLNGFVSNQDFYFVHSYVFKPIDAQHIIATTHYGEEFPSIVGRDNIFGVQFHPEKSQKAGKLLLTNFLNLSSAI